MEGCSRVQCVMPPGVDIDSMAPRLERERKLKVLVLVFTTLGHENESYRFASTARMS